LGTAAIATHAHPSRSRDASPSAPRHRPGEVEGLGGVVGADGDAVSHLQSLRVDADPLVVVLLPIALQERRRAPLNPHRRSPSTQPSPSSRIGPGGVVSPSLTLMGSPTQEIRLLFCFFFLPCSIFLGDGISGMLSSTSSSSSASRTAKLGHLGTRGPSLQRATAQGDRGPSLGRRGGLWQEASLPAKDAPPLQTSLLAPSTAPKLHHVLASLALPALGLLADLEQGEGTKLSAGRCSGDAPGRRDRDREELGGLGKSLPCPQGAIPEGVIPGMTWDPRTGIGSHQLRASNPPRYLADAAAPALHGVLLVVLLLVLLDLLREEGVEDEVHQLGGGGFGGTLVLVYLGGVPDGLPPDSSPATKVTAVRGDLVSPTAAAATNSPAPKEGSQGAELSPRHPTAKDHGGMPEQAPRQCRDQHGVPKGCYSRRESKGRLWSEGFPSFRRIFTPISQCGSHRA